MELPNENNKPNTQGIGIVPKLIALVGAIVLGLFALGGFQFNISSIINSVLMISVAVFLFYLAWLGIQSLRKQKPFSPMESLTNKYIRIAEMSKPDNVKELFLRGDDMRLFSRLGKITGILFIPYLASVPVLDENNNPVLIDKRNKFGAIEKDEYGKPILIQKMKTMTEKNGDWLFIVKKGIMDEKILIRAHHELVSTVSEKMWINDVNVVPIGEYYYPAKQWQENIKRVQAQHQAEAVIETHAHFLDLISTITETTLSADPNYLRMMFANNEALSDRGGVGLGGNR